MANTYTSSHVETGLAFDELIGRLLAYKPEQWGFTEQDYNKIASDFGVSSNDLWYLPTGNYKVTNLTNSPFDSSFVNISVTDLGNKKFFTCDIGGIEKYTLELSAAGSAINWVNNSQGSETDAIIFYTGVNAPTDTTMMWVDISKLSTEDIVYLRYNNGTRWVSYSFNDIMLQDIYDQHKLNKDPYDAVEEAIEEFITNYGEFGKHINNETTLIHLSAEDKEYYNTHLLTSAYLAQYFSVGGILHNELVSYINSKTNDFIGINLSESETSANNLANSIESFPPDIQTHTLSPGLSNSNSFKALTKGAHKCAL